MAVAGGMIRNTCRVFCFARWSKTISKGKGAMDILEAEPTCECGSKNVTFIMSPTSRVFDGVAGTLRCDEEDCGRRINAIKHHRRDYPNLKVDRSKFDEFQGMICPDRSR